jgi:hypothetical protein
MQSPFNELDPNIIEPPEGTTAGALLAAALWDSSRIENRHLHRQPNARYSSRLDADRLRQLETNIYDF